MGDPERLLSSLGEDSELERELLASIQRVDPPAGAKGEGWARLSAQIAAVALLSSAHGSAAAASSAASSSAAGTGAVAPSAVAAGGASAGGLAPVALKLLSSKIAVALAVTGAALGTTAVWVHVSDKHPAAPIAAVAAAQPAPPASASALIAAPNAPDPALQLTPAADPAAKQSSSTEQRRKDMLSAESALLTEARAQLRNGDAAAAQQSLNKLRAKFPKGMLGQEREVLAIEVLAARGNKDAARRRAQAFIAAYPESPHSAQLSRFADAP